MFKRTTFFILLLLIMMSAITYAAPGDLDTTFNPPDGVVTYGGADDDDGYAVAIQSDGKIVVAGDSSNGADLDLLILRYNTDGSLDNSFGTNGVVTYDSGDDDGGRAVGIQSDGKIVVAGGSRIGTKDDVLVLRYDSDGSLDNSFGANGVVTYDHGGYDYGYAVAIQSDGKIVVAGQSITATCDVLVLTYNPDGSLDNSFGTNGVVTYDSGKWDNCWAATIQSDGKIVVAAATLNGAQYDALILRYNTDGSLDTGFGANGIVTYDGGEDDLNSAVAIQSDGKIVVAGESGSGIAYDALILRYNTDGSLDTGFGANGIVTYDGGEDDYGYAVTIQSGGKIVVSGGSYNGTDNDVMVLRFSSDGSLDNSFGANGVVTYEYSQGTEDYGEAVAIQSDGKIVVAGETGIKPAWVFDVLVARFSGDAPAPSSISSSGDDGGSCFITSAAYGFRR